MAQVRMRNTFAHKSALLTYMNLGYVSHTAQNLLGHLRHPAEGETGRIPFGVHMRTLGDVAYFMTSLNTPPSTVRILERAIIEALTPCDRLGLHAC
jgi:hypothetical protein